MSAGFHGDAVVEQDRYFLSELILRLGIRNSYLRALGFQKQRRGHARPAEADYEHAFVVDVHEIKPHHGAGEAQRG